MHFSSQFATSPATPEHIAISEKLGYQRSWLFDTPHQSPELWMSLAMAAERTETIGLGPAVIVPALRHPMVTASGGCAEAGDVSIPLGRLGEPADIAEAVLFLASDRAPWITPTEFIIDGGQFQAR